MSSFISYRRSSHRQFHHRQASAAAMEPLENRLLLSTNYWKTAVSGDWENPANWSLNHVPLAAEHVAITAAGNYTVSVHGTANVANNLILGSAAAKPTLSLISDDTDGNASLTVADGLTNDGNLVLADNSLNGNYPTLTVSSGTLANAAGATITAASSANALFGDYIYTQAISNAGDINIITPRGLSLSAASGVNIGVINLGGGNLNLNGSGVFTNSGNINVGAARTFFAGGGTFAQTAGTLGGAGASLDFSYVTLNLATPFSTTAGNLTATYSTINDSGTITNAAGKTLTLNFSTVNAPLSNRGMLDIYGDDNAINGALSIAAGANLNVMSDYRPSAAAALTVAHGFNNYGNITLTNDSPMSYVSSLIITSGTLFNAAGATITAAGDADAISGDVNNAGTLAVRASQGLSLDGDFTQASSGTYAATLPLPGAAIAGNASLSGTLDIATAAGFHARAGGSYAVMTYSGVTGDFSKLAGTNIGGGVMLAGNEQPTAFTLTGVAAANLAAVVFSNLPIQAATPDTLDGDAVLLG